MIDKTKYINMSQDELNDKILQACYNGNLDIVKYLLTSPELKEHADIYHKNNNHGSNFLMCACMNGHLDIAQYLLTSPQLKEHADINHKNNNGWNALMFACKNGRLDIVQYLIIDMNMDIDEETMNWLQGNNRYNTVYEDILKVIEIRNLHQKLDGSINTDNKKANGIKV